MQQKQAGLLKRVSFFLSHKIRKHNVEFYFKNLGKTNLFTVSCKTCKKGVCTEYVGKFPDQETGERS